MPLLGKDRIYTSSHREAIGNGYVSKPFQQTWEERALTGADGNLLLNVVQSKTLNSAMTLVMPVVVMMVMIITVVLFNICVTVKEAGPILNVELKTGVINRVVIEMSHEVN